MKSEDQPFRFFDNREKYLLFVTTTSEKAVTAEHVGREFDWIKPKPATKNVLLRHGGLWFQDKSFVVVRVAEELSDGNSTKPYLRLANND